MAEGGGAECDLLVVGAGPAGTATAIAAARRGLRVIILDRRELPFVKVCGEFLSPGGLETWRRLSGREPPAGTPLLSTVRFRSPGRESPPVALDPPARGLTRAFLDGALVEAAIAAGADARLGVSLLGHERDGPGFRATISRRGRRETIASDRLVIATGRPVLRSPARRWWIGRKATCERVPTGADLEMWILPNGGYAGLSPVETGEMTLCALTRSGGEEWLSHPSVAGVQLRVGPAIARFSLGRQAEPADGAHRVGDALAVWPPVVGDGISAAMALGTALGELLAGGPPGDPSSGPEAWRAAWEHCFLRRLLLAQALHGGLASRPGRLVLLTLARSVPPAARWLVRATRTVPAARHGHLSITT